MATSNPAPRPDQCEKMEVMWADESVYGPPAPGSKVGDFIQTWLMGSWNCGVFTHREIAQRQNRAVLHVEVIFWSGKRKIPPSLVSGKYCPHFVVTGTTEYLGVCFLDGTECTFDTPALGNAQPLYPDTIDYAPLENNAEFLIYEGANAVGKGRVLGRTIPYKVKQQRK